MSSHQDFVEDQIFSQSIASHSRSTQNHDFSGMLSNFFLTLLGVSFVTFSAVLGDLHLGYHKVQLEEAGSYFRKTT